MHPVENRKPAKAEPLLFHISQTRGSIRSHDGELFGGIIRSRKEIMTNPDTMTNEELRVAVAEAMGWTEIRDPKTFNSLFASDQHFAKSPFGLQPGINRNHPSLVGESKKHEPPEDWWVLIPKYTTDHNAAMTLCDALAKEGWEPNFRKWKGQWEAWFQTIEETFLGTGPTLPIAICRAFLAVIQSQTPTT